MGGILSIQDIFDHHIVWGENQKTACKISVNMGLVDVRAAEGCRRGGRGAAFHIACVDRNHIVNRCEWPAQPHWPWLLSLHVCVLGFRDFGSSNVLKLGRLMDVKGGRAKCCRVWEVHCEVTSQPKRQAWIVSKYKLIRKTHSTIPPEKKQRKPNIWDAQMGCQKDK